MKVSRLGNLKQALVLCAFCVMGATVHAGDDKYTMDDLRLLDQQKSFQEIMDHMDDIRPSQRNEEWTEIVTRAAVNALKNELTGGDAYMAQQWSEQVLQSVPALNGSKEFMDLRNKAVLDGSAQCYRDYYGGSECTDNLRKVVLQDPVNKELAFKAGKMVRLNMNASVAVPFFIRALKEDPDSKICSDPDVFLAVSAGMGVSGEGAKDAMELGFSLCFNALKSQLLEDFYSTNGYALDNYCTAFSEKKMLTKFQTAYCSDQAD